MFRKMRRSKQELSKEENIKILCRNTSGVLAVCENGDYPYAVPLSYVYSNSKIYFHSALTGHKIDAILKNNKASFCVIDADDVVPEKFTTLYKSVIVFGQISVVNDDTEKLEAIKMLNNKYSPEFESKGIKEINDSFNRFCIIKLEIKHLSGKQCIELVK